MKDSNLRRLSRRIYSPLPLATRATRRAVVPEKSTRTVDGVPGPPGGAPRPAKGMSHGRRVLRRREQGRPPGDRQRPQPGGARSCRSASTSAGTNATIEWAGEAGVTLQADTEERVAAALDVFKEKLIKRGISLKVPGRRRAAGLGQELQDLRPDQAGHRVRHRQEDRQADPRRGPQGRPGADPGRPAAGQRQEARRPAGGAAAAARRRPRRRPAVRQLPLTRDRANAPSPVSDLRATTATCRQRAGGWTRTQRPSSPGHPLEPGDALRPSAGGWRTSSPGPARGTGWRSSGGSG